MRTPASIRGHPIHPMLVPIAIGCFVFSFAADLIRLFSGNATPWLALAYYTMLGGIVGALAAAVPGFIDLLSLRGPAQRTATLHMVINLGVVALYAGNAWLRHAEPHDTALPTALSTLGILSLLVSGWLGGKMVFEAGVGVQGEGVR
ncbi:MAG TPA: DUF2231 domain-containing protein [Usitatibacter sp.]|nr:DUF2231 domain-containing protein [Usitatibacter sp.]